MKTQLQSKLCTVKQVLTVYTFDLLKTLMIHLFGQKSKLEESEVFLILADFWLRWWFGLLATRKSFQVEGESERILLLR